MAQKVEVHLDGGPAGDTLTFALDSKDYKTDLFTTDAEKLCEALRLYTDASRKTTRSSGPRRTRTSGSDPETTKIRAWAKENGHEVSDRGRIHQSVKDAYYAAY